MPKKNFTTITLGDETLEKLEAQPDWAGNKKKMVERLINEAIALRSGDLAQIVERASKWNNQQKLDLALAVLASMKMKTPSGLVERILRGECPTDCEIIEACQSDDLDEERLFDIRAKLFVEVRQQNA